MSMVHPAATRCPTSFLGAHHARNERRSGIVVAIAVLGLLGALVISQWSIKLMASAGRSLLDARDNAAFLLRIRERLRELPGLSHVTVEVNRRTGSSAT